MTPLDIRPRLRDAIAGLAVLVTVAAGPCALAAPPDWVLRIARTESPAYDPTVSAVILLDELTLAVGPTGVATRRTRGAMRILTQAGQRLAVGRFDYVAGTEKVTSSSVWLLRDGKEFRPPKSKPWSDIVADTGATAYSEYRAKVMDYSEIASNGDVFVWEGEVAGPLLFANKLFAWNNGLPTLAQRYQLTVPNGWPVRTLVDGPLAPVEARQDGAKEITLSWILRDLPPRRDEPFIAEDGAFHARVFVSFEPEAAAKGLSIPAFKSWSDVATWWRELASPQCDASPAMAAEVARLVAGCQDDVARMRAIAGYVQRLRYVSADRSVGIGFGYRPRKASEVFTRGWGDCKDKSNLMRAMLREAGISSALAAIRIGGGRDINADWPTPSQFNHAIVAISLPPGVRVPMTVQTRTMGEVVFFDPTSAHTWFGDVPHPLQGATAHVIGDAADELVVVPKADPQENFRTERLVRATLARDGSIQGACQVVAHGQSGARLRGMVRGWTARELEEHAGEFISDVLRGAHVSGIKFTDDEAAGHSTLALEFSTPKAVQLMPQGAMLVRLDLLSRRGLPAFPAKTRTHPVYFPPFVVVDRIEVRVPEGFAAEELPRPTNRETRFGSYAMAVTADGSTIVTDRRLGLVGGITDVADYANLRQFLNEVASADKAAVVVAPRP